MNLIVEKDIPLAERLLGQNRINEAVDCLVRVIQQKPENFPAITLLAKIVHGQPEQLENIDLVWKQLVISEPQIADMLLDHGEVLLSGGRYLLAQKAFGTVQLYTSHPDAILMLIKFWNVSGYPRQARMYLVALEKQGNHPSTCIMFANTYALEHDSKNAAYWWIKAFNYLTENVLIQARPLLNCLAVYREDYGVEIHNELGLSSNDFNGLLKIATYYLDGRYAEFKQLINKFSTIRVRGGVHVINFDRVILDEKIDNQISSFTGLDSNKKFIFNLLQQNANTARVEPKRAKKKKLHLHFSMNLKNGGTERHMMRTLTKSESDCDNIIITCQMFQSQNSSNLMEMASANGIQVDSVNKFADNSTLLNSTLDNESMMGYKENLNKHVDAEMISACMNAIYHYSPAEISIWGVYLYKTAAIASYLTDVQKVTLHMVCQLMHSYSSSTLRNQLSERFIAGICTMLLADPRFNMVINTKAIWSDLKQNFPIQNAEKRVKIKYNPFPRDLVQQDPQTSLKVLRQELQIPESRKIMGVVTRIAVEKNIPLWVKTAEIVSRTTKNIIFIIIGNGATIEFVVDLAKSLEIYDICRFVDECTLDLKQYYQLMDVFLLTSDTEGLPNTLLEAQALAVPVVARNVDGVEEAVWHGKTGLVVSTDKPEILAEAVQKVLTDKRFQQQARRYGPGFVKRLCNTPVISVEKSEEIFVALREPSISENLRSIFSFSFFRSLLFNKGP